MCSEFCSYNVLFQLHLNKDLFPHRTTETILKPTVSLSFLNSRKFIGKLKKVNFQNDISTGKYGKILLYSILSIV